MTMRFARGKSNPARHKMPLIRPMEHGFHRGRSLLSLLLAAIFLTVWLVPSSILPVGAAVTALSVRYRYVSAENAHELYWAAADQPGLIRYNWHKADGTLANPADQTTPDVPGTPNPVYRYATENGQKTVVLRLPLESDHIHDITIQVFSDAGGLTQTGSAAPYVLSGMTFQAESFDQSANTLVENAPLLEDADGNPLGAPPASKVLSGTDPKILLRWKVPTVYAGGAIHHITEPAADWRGGIQKTLSIESVGFYFTMNKGRNTTVPMEFKTYYDTGVMRLGGATVGGIPPAIGGIGAGGIPTDSDGFITASLDKTDGIESGTEYQNLKMGLTLATVGGAPLLISNTNLLVGSANAFSGYNNDVAFEEYGALTSVFTPMEYEMAKVDTDKVEVRFRRVTNGVYTKLFYEIQDLSGNDLNFPNDPAVRGNWVTIPDSSLTEGALYGSVILPFAVVNGQLPDRYIRVICSEQGAALPRNTSMVNSLTLLGGQTGRPALPQNLTVEAKYGGLQTVTVGGVPVEIPTSTLVLTFDKPSVWSAFNGAAWTAYRAAASAGTDPVFNLLLSTLLPDVPDGQITDSLITLSDAHNTVSVQNPVRQKRTVVIGKQQLSEVAGNTSRLTCEIDGTSLFMDYASDPDVALTDENNEVGTRGPYPDFLIPNMTYYLQAFTARYEDLAALNAAVWADRGNNGDGLPAALKDAISYASPILSFTTYPIREVPVPLPVLSLSVSPAVTADPATGKMQLDGIDVAYEHILKETDWKRYLSTEQWNLYDTETLNADNERRVELSVEYRFFIAKEPPTDAADFFDAGTETVTYPAVTATPPVHAIRSVPDLDMPAGADPGAEKILPNTTYYIKAHPYLLVTERPAAGGAATVTSLGYTMDTAVKTITTPKLDLVSLDNITRNPRAPTEFSVASDADGNPRLTDASVVMQWMHREPDVGYEMMVTSVVPDPDADPDTYADDPILIDLLAEYRTRTPNLVDGNVLWIPLNDAAARAAMQTGLGLTLNASTLAVLCPIDGFLEPNTQYYFSIRTVRSRGTVDADGNPNPPPSRWITVPVTTPLVKAPEGLEVVRDLEVGFSVTSALPKGDPANYEIYMKKSAEPDSAYVKLSRDRYTVVRDGTTYYWRVGGLASDAWYDFRLRHIPPDATWYDATTRTWNAAVGAAITAKTRDALHEIEVRWVGEAAYEYYLEARAENETDYTALSYAASGVTDIGYETKTGVRSQYYVDRTAAQVVSGPVRKMMYARILRKRMLQADGTYASLPLRTNTMYHVRLWARNPAVATSGTDTAGKADSLHVGPVTTRTDFSQDDYDLAKDKENILDLYDMQADSLAAKPYWIVDKGANNAVRVLLKGARVQAMLGSAPEATQVIALDVENDNAALYEVTIPEQVLETIRTSDARLAIRVAGAEYMISRSSFSLPALKSQVASSAVKETMLRVRITRSDTPSAVIPSLYGKVSKVYAFSAEAIGSRYAKGYLDTVVESILEDPTATGPFRYGLLDRERAVLDKNALAYTYKVHTDLVDTVGGVVGRAEAEMSRYLKDLLDGGSGLAAFSVQKAAVLSYPGSVLVRHAYTYDNGRILPLILPAGTATWKEPPGLRAFTDSQAAFRIDGPAASVIVSSKGVQGASAVTWPGLVSIAGRYDLTHAFGTKSVYPTNTVSGKEAVLLFEVLSERPGEAQGLSMSQKLALLGLGNVIQARTLLLPVDNQRAVSWAVLLYAQGAGRTVDSLKPVATPAIANLSEVLPALQKPVVSGLDMGLAKLDTRRRFNAAGTSNVGTMLEMAAKVLDMLGR